MAICALATESELAAALDRLAPLPAFVDLRTPETGLVMVRGRTGGEGRPFNFGETTVARACVRLESGETGHGYVLGRSAAKARLAAIVDALGQSPLWAERIESSLAAPVRTRVAGERAAQHAETAATRVDFFTLVRGED
jgi:alpha-D-ribose 1-methylphosphonate 5-triphosphate synthase subunit PhnG